MHQLDLTTYTTCSVMILVLFRNGNLCAQAEPLLDAFPGYRVCRQFSTSEGVDERDGSDSEMFQQVPENVETFLSNAGMGELEASTAGYPSKMFNVRCVKLINDERIKQTPCHSHRSIFSQKRTPWVSACVRACMRGWEGG